MKKLLCIVFLTISIPAISWCMEKEEPKTKLINLITSDNQTIITTSTIINMLPTLKEAAETSLGNGTIPVNQTAPILSLVLDAMERLQQVPIFTIDPNFFDTYSYKDIPAQTQEALKRALDGTDNTTLAQFINALDYFAVEEGILIAASNIWVAQVAPWYNPIAQMFTKRISNAVDKAEQYNINPVIIDTYIQSATDAKQYSIADLVALKKIPSIQNNTLNLSEQNIVSLIGMYLIPFSTRRTIQKLDLSLNNIPAVPQKAFEGFLELEKLEIAGNAIKIIEPGTFESIKTLKKLYLEYNKLEKLTPKTFGNLPQLRKLVLENNNITNIASGTLEGLTTLQQLYLFNNKLKQLNPQLFTPLRRHLRYLEVSGNQLSKENIDQLRQQLPNAEIIP